MGLRRCFGAAYERVIITEWGGAEDESSRWSGGGAQCRASASASARWGAAERGGGGGGGHGCHRRASEGRLAATSASLVWIGLVALAAALFPVGFPYLFPIVFHICSPWRSLAVVGSCHRQIFFKKILENGAESAHCTRSILRGRAF